MICSQTHLIAIGTGSGLAILTAPLNRHGLMEMLPKGTGKKASENEMTVLVHIKGGISQREFMSVQKVVRLLKGSCSMFW